MDRRDAGAGRSTPPRLQVGATLAGGVVVSSAGFDEHVVRMPSGAIVRVVLGAAGAIGREADLLRRVGGSGPFPRLVDTGMDPACGPYLTLEQPEGARSLGEVGPSMSFQGALGVVRAMLDVGQILEQTGFAWEPVRDDVHVHEDGTVRLSRVRVARRLGPAERLDARAVVEAIGPTFVPVPAIDGPPRGVRLLLPHVALAGERGSTVDDVRAEVAAVEGDAEMPAEGSRTAGVCDPGLRRSRNEDALACASGSADGLGWTALVVCDGVSSSSDADRASAIAARTACDTIAHLARSGRVAVDAGEGAVVAAIQAAHRAVCELSAAGEAGEDDAPPGTTIVVGFVWGRRLTVGWVGDSRAYWISPQREELLTTDHSWVNEAVARGEATLEQASQSPLAHALTRCLGPLEPFDRDDGQEERRARIREVACDVRTFDLPAAGWVVLCSDGLWNYFPAPRDIATLVCGAGPGSSPARVARRLVHHALARGGQDNTTVLVHEHDPLARCPAAP